MQTSTILQLLGIVLGSQALFEFIKWAVELIVNKNESPERIALRALCERDLDQMLHHWLHSDERTADDWRIIENLYTGYSGLKGNGEIRKLYEEAKAIPTTE